MYLADSKNSKDCGLCGESKRREGDEVKKVIGPGHVGPCGLQVKLAFTESETGFCAQEWKIWLMSFASIEMILWFVLYSINVVYYID